MRIRKRPYGDSFVSVLLVVTLLLGTGIWAYMRFVRNRELANGDQRWYSVLRDVNSTAGREASLAYQRHMRERAFADTLRAVRDAAEFVNHHYASADDFEQRYSEVLAELRDNLNDLDSREVPAAFDPGHFDLCRAHKLAYEAMQLRAAAHAQPNAAQLQRAQQLADTAVRTVQSGIVKVKSQFG